MTGVLTACALAVAGALGAVCRVLGDGVVRRRRPGPLGVVVVNVSGSFALGVLTGWLGGWAPDVLLLAGTGFLGAYTTFSTAMVDVVSVVRDPRRPYRARAMAGVALTLGPAALAVAAAAAGLLVGAGL